MPLKTFVVPVTAPESAENLVNSFTSGHRVTGIRKEFVAAGESSFWAILVDFVSSDAQKGRQEAISKVDYKAILSADDFERFSRLREIRKACAEEKGVPPYAVFTNEQLAWLAGRNPLDQASFTAMPDTPKSRIETWAPIFLDRLKSAPSQFPV